MRKMEAGRKGEPGEGRLGQESMDHIKDVYNVFGELWCDQVRDVGGKGGQKSSLGHITEGLECPAKEFGLHPIAFEYYPIKGS